VQSFLLPTSNFHNLRWFESTAEANLYDIASPPKRRVRVAPEAQAIFCCRRQPAERATAPISHCDAKAKAC